MTIGFTIVHFVIKEAMIVCYHIWTTRLSSTHGKSKMAAKNLKWPPGNLVVFLHFNIRPLWFPAHHGDRLVYTRSTKHNIMLILVTIYMFWLWQLKKKIMMQRNTYLWFMFPAYCKALSFVELLLGFCQELEPSKI